MDIGINAGNPTFAQTNNNIIAFDIFDDNNKLHYVMEVNLYSGELNYIIYFSAEDFYSGYPCYSSDDKNIIFHAFIENDQQFNIYKVPMDNTKIASSDESIGYIVEAVFPKWFAIGSRPDGIADNSISSELKINIIPNPVSENAMITYNLPEDGEISMKIFSDIGKTIAALKENEYKSAGAHSIVWETIQNNGKRLSAGLYYCEIRFISNSGNLIRKTALLCVD